jgi:hypothetical protein
MYSGSLRATVICFVLEELAKTASFGTGGPRIEMIRQHWLLLTRAVRAGCRVFFFIERREHSQAPIGLLEKLALLFDLT